MILIPVAIIQGRILGIRTINIQVQVCNGKNRSYLSYVKKT